MPASTTTILSFLEPFDNPAYILPDKPRIDAAQAVIGAGLENDDIGLQGQHPIDTRQGAAGRLAAHPGVDHPHVKASLLQLPLQQGRVALLFRYPQAGSEAVPDRDDGQGGLGRHGRRGRHGDLLLLPAPPEQTEKNDPHHQQACSVHSLTLLMKYGLFGMTGRSPPLRLQTARPHPEQQEHRRQDGATAREGKGRQRGEPLVEPAEQDGGGEKHDPGNQIEPAEGRTLQAVGGEIGDQGLFHPSVAAMNRP
jgi:hypothetical protein